MSVTAELLEAVREEARPDTWSAGMGLARAGAVSVQSVADLASVKADAKGSNSTHLYGSLEHSR
ncbi:hypothetical protein JQX13_40420 [Archangium violaceum]|uniref:hypothetical protein n=1 Tax=Archangium violaceum TaxID=83451 RepID=UPI00193B0A23|nr:hypothetical protein [Archangium violaceum]QRK06314.1 hypothetical protein JQX13_40420 [Archangium violaceum]